MDTTDAIVIGSGPNGLAAAITLAEQERRVLVLEARDQPGGAVATAELTLPGFRHDVFSAVHPAGAASPVFARMPLEQHGLHWIHPPVALAHPLPDGRAAALYQSVDQTAANLDELHPGDGQRWQELVSPYLHNFAALRDVLLAGFPPVAGSTRLLAALGMGGMLEFARQVVLPATALASELFASEEAPAWLYGSALHSDTPLDAAGSGVAALYLKLLGHGAGWPSPQGGADGLTQALVGYLESLGGKVRLQTPVERIVIENGRVRGVVTASDEWLLAPVVVASVMPHALLHLTGDTLPTHAPAYARQLQRYRYGPPSFKVDWALAAPIPWEAPEARQAGTVHVGGGPADLLTAQRQLRAGVMPEQPFLLLGQQSLADPTRAPAGQHTAWGYTHPPQGMTWDANTRQFCVDLIEWQIERFAPGFRQHILARHILAPPDLEARNRNLVQGDVGGGSYALDQLVFRPVPGLVPYRTPIKGLYLGSAATFPGAAVHGVAGAAAARLAVAEGAVRRWW